MAALSAARCKRTMFRQKSFKTRMDRARNPEICIPRELRTSDGGPKCEYGFSHPRPPMAYSAFVRQTTPANPALALRNDAARRDGDELSSRRAAARIGAAYTS